MSPSRSYARSAIGATAVFLILLSAFYALLSFTGRSPVIEGIQPQSAAPGEQIVITGDHFGNTRGRGNVRIAGSVPTSSTYLEWSDSRILMRVPEDASSGLVYVETERGRSNGVLFANAAHVPQRADTTESSARPKIGAIEPQSVPPGTIITIRGSRFGSNRNDSRVTFAWESAEGDRDRIAVSASEYGYVYWSARELRVRVPDGATSGNVVVETARGRSPGIGIEIERPVGTRRFAGRRSHAVAVSVTVDSIQIADEGSGGTLYLWAPRVSQSPEQRNYQVLTESEPPLFSRAEGVSLYRLRNPRPGQEWTLRRTALFDRYAVETEIDAAAVPFEYDQPDAFMRRYTEPNAILPVDADAVQAEAARLLRTARNPYVRALRTYERVLSVLEPRSQVGPVDAVAALESGTANPFGYATLTAALLRAQEIPARVVSGHLVCSDSALERHYWVEFYVEQFGWVPLDPAAADGAVCEDFVLPEDPGGFYFGNTDAERISFSTGMVTVPRMHPEGRTERVRTMYSLQTHHHEAVGDIRWYRVRWHDVTYLGEY